MSLIRYTYTPIVPEYIRITKCSERTFWYRGRVGEILKVRSLDGADYIVEGPDTDSIYFVAVQDCEPVRDHSGVRGGETIETPSQSRPTN